MLDTLGRISFGFVLACLAAALTMVLHLFTPVDVFKADPGTFSENAANAALLTLLAATHTAIFASAFAFIAVGVAEYLHIRSMPYYLFTGAAITVLGFIAQYLSETAGQLTIFNSYAIQAFLTAGLASGLVYWFIAGRYAGRSKRDAGMELTTGGTQTVQKASALPQITIAERAAKAVNKASSLTAKLAQDEKPEQITPNKPEVKADQRMSGSVPLTKPVTAKVRDIEPDDTKGA